jgi:hypothetical protein
LTGLRLRCTREAALGGRQRGKRQIKRPAEMLMRWSRCRHTSLMHRVWQASSATSILLISAVLSSRLHHGQRQRLACQMRRRHSPAALVLSWQRPCCPACPLNIRLVAHTLKKLVGSH